MTDLGFIEFSLDVELQRCVPYVDRVIHRQRFRDNATLLSLSIVILGNTPSEILERSDKIASRFLKHYRSADTTEYCPLHPWPKLYIGKADTVNSTVVYLRQSRQGIAIAGDYLLSLPEITELPYPGVFEDEPNDYIPRPTPRGMRVCPACSDIARIHREISHGFYQVVDTVWTVGRWRIYIDPSE